MVSLIRRGAARLAGWEIWAVALLSLGGMAANRFLPYALLGAGLFWPVRWAASGRPSVRTPADGPVLLVVGMLAVTWGVTALPELTRPQVLRTLSGVLLYFAVANWAVGRGRLRIAAAGLALAGMGLAISAPVTVEWPAGKLPFIPAAVYERFLVLVPDTVHPNVLAGSLALLLPLAAAMALFGGRRAGWGVTLLAGLACLPMLAALALSQSRGAWMAAALALALLPVLRWRWGWLGLLLLGGLAGGALYQFGWAFLVEKVLVGGAVNGLDGRLEIWSRAIYMLQDFSFTGIGMGAFGPVADKMYPFFLAGEGSIPHAHNLFLQVGVDLGLPGLVGWLGVLLLAVAGAGQIYRAGRRQGDLWLAGLGAGLLASQVALVVHGMTDAVTWGMVRPAPLVWALWGLAAAGWLNVRASQGAVFESL